MSLRRYFSAACAAAFLTTALPARGEGWPQPRQTQQQDWKDSGTGIRKDDSRLTVVQEEGDQDEPIVHVANKPKSKKTNSVWNRLRHPTQWFSSQKKAKR
jgi:hypothetical protein